MARLTKNTAGCTHLRTEQVQTYFIPTRATPRSALSVQITSSELETFVTDLAILWTNAALYARAITKPLYVKVLVTCQILLQQTLFAKDEKKT
tara:strand:+ start:447 stop:725 length:279 start_codon:yes stop_codon:yes gene_type:complete